MFTVVVWQSVHGGYVFPMAQNDLQKYEVQIKSLQAHSEQQGKVLKRKTEEVNITNTDLPSRIMPTLHNTVCVCV